MDLFAVNVNSGEMLPPKDFNLKIVTRGSILANQLAIPLFYRQEIQQMADINLTSI